MKHIPHTTSKLNTNKTQSRTNKYLIHRIWLCKRKKPETVHQHINNRHRKSY